MVWRTERSEKRSVLPLIFHACPLHACPLHACPPHSCPPADRRTTPMLSRARNQGQRGFQENLSVPTLYPKLSDGGSDLSPTTSGHPSSPRRQLLIKGLHCLLLFSVLTSRSTKRCGFRNFLIVTSRPPSDHSLCGACPCTAISFRPERLGLVLVLRHTEKII